MATQLSTTNRAAEVAMAAPPARGRRSRRAVTAALTLLITIGIGGALSTAGAYLGWRIVDPAPSPAQLTQIIDAARPHLALEQNGGPVYGSLPSRTTGLPFVWDREVEDFVIDHLPTSADNPGRWIVMIPGATPSWENYHALRDHLQHDGWEIGSASESFDDGLTASFSAVKDGVHMNWGFRFGSHPNPDSLAGRVWHDTPWQVKALSALGWALAALLGWWFNPWRRPLRNGYLATVTTFWAVAAVGSLSGLFALLICVINLFGISIYDGPPIPQWIPYAPFLAPFGIELF
jgi:hypothetical protein